MPAKGQTEQGRETCRKILALITTHIESEGYPPTLRWLSKESGLVVSNVLHHLNRLEMDGAIERKKGASRGIKVMKDVVY